MERKNGKRPVSAGIFLMLGISALGLAGCASRTREAKTSIRIGVTLYDQYDTFIGETIDSFNKYISEYNDSHDVKISVEVQDAAGNQSTQNDQVRSLIEQGCDVICVNLVDRTEPTTITDLAEKKDVPIIFFNRELVEEDLERWEKLYYVGADAFQSGIMEGEIAADTFLNSPGADRNGDGICQYFILEGEPGHQDAIVRTESSINALAEAGIDTEKIGYGIANWNRGQAQTKTASMLVQYADAIDLIMANNDEMAIGAIDALKAAGFSMEDWPIVTGIDGTTEGLAALEKGELAGTVFNDGDGQAKSMLELSCALALDEDLTKLDLPDGVSLQGGKYIRLPYSKIIR